MLSYKFVFLYLYTPLQRKVFDMHIDKHSMNLYSQFQYDRYRSTEVIQIILIIYIFLENQIFNEETQLAVDIYNMMYHLMISS